VLKLDFEKAYDKIKWPFLQQALRIKDSHLCGVNGSIRLCQKGVSP
jgi:hypothetical protein